LSGQAKGDSFTKSKDYANAATPSGIPLRFAFIV